MRVRLPGAGGTVAGPRPRVRGGFALSRCVETCLESAVINELGEQLTAKIRSEARHSRIQESATEKRSMLPEAKMKP